MSSGITLKSPPIAETVGVKLRHCSEVGGENFTVPGFQRSYEKIYSLFGSFVDFF
jgi:hypothetical protein